MRCRFLVKGYHGRVRASDVERERAVAALQRHYSEGRLDHAELEERVACAYAARTRLELEAPFSDLPKRPTLRVRRRPTASWHLWVYLAFCTAITAHWALLERHPETNLTQLAGAFWPIWLIGPWGLALALGFAVTRRRQHGRRGASARSMGL